jgi:hypothetical protein
MTKQRPCKKIPLLNLELWNEFFAKNIPETPKIKLRQAPTAIFAAAILVNIYPDVATVTTPPLPLPLLTQFLLPSQLSPLRCFCSATGYMLIVVCCLPLLLLPPTLPLHTPLLPLFPPVLLPPFLLLLLPVLPLPIATSTSPLQRLFPGGSNCCCYRWCHTWQKRR